MRLNELVHVRVAERCAASHAETVGVSHDIIFEDSKNESWD